MPLKVCLTMATDRLQAVSATPLSSRRTAIFFRFFGRLCGTRNPADRAWFGWLPFRPSPDGALARLAVVCGGIVALLASALFFKETASRSHWSYLATVNLHNIYEALFWLDTENGGLPAATGVDGTTGHQVSWRVEVYERTRKAGFIRTPFRNGLGFAYDRQKAWNAPENLRIQEYGWPLFSYTQTERHPPGQSGQPFATYYKLITGPGTAFDASLRPSLRELPNDLIILVRVEVSNTHWMAPGDLDILTLLDSQQGRRLLLGRYGYVVLFADGRAWVLSAKTPFTDLCKFFTIVGAARWDRDRVLGRYRVIR